MDINLSGQLPYLPVSISGRCELWLTYRGFWIRKKRGYISTWNLVWVSKDGLPSFFSRSKQNWSGWLYWRMDRLRAL